MRDKPSSLTRNVQAAAVVLGQLLTAVIAAVTVLVMYANRVYEPAQMALYKRDSLILESTLIGLAVFAIVATVSGVLWARGTQRVRLLFIACIIIQIIGAAFLAIFAYPIDTICLGLLIIPSAISVVVLILTMRPRTKMLNIHARE